MRLIFVGPTLPDAADIVAHAAEPVRILPPARQGDVVRAVAAGARIIGLIDGYFERVPAVWHKEILHALDLGITVLGGGSIGALRAAECAAFGMIPVGTIARDYLCGARVDDADVAQLHGPAELGYPALTEPLVNAEAVIAAAKAEGVVGEEAAAHLLAAARRLFFKDRTWQAVVTAAGLPDPGAITNTLKAMARRVNPKRDDAIRLAHMVAGLSPLPSGPAPGPWQFRATSQFKTIISSK